MKTKLHYLGIAVVFLCITLNSNAQNPAISKLDSLLFPKDVKTGLLKTFGWQGKTYEVRGRDFELNQKEINKVLFEIRESRDSSVVKDLIAIQKKHEDYFLREWEKAWRVGHFMYDYNYSVLMNLELTLQYLEVIHSTRSEIEKYRYFKNIHFLQWVDRDTVRKDNINFYSDYIKDQWHAACISSDLCTNLLIIEQAEKFKKGILHDLENFNADNLSQGEIRFHLILLGKAAINIDSEEVEDIYMERIEVFDSLVLSEATDYGREIWIYNILCERAREKGLRFLLDDLSSEELFRISRFIASKYRLSEIGRIVLKERLKQEILLHKGKKRQRHFIMGYTETFNDDASMKELEEISCIIDNQNMDLLEK